MQHKEIITAAILDKDPNANQINITQVVDNFIGGTVYYIEYTSPQINISDSFYYALIDSYGKVRLYDDGIEVIESLQDILDKRRTFIQRLNEFSLVELVGAIIAILITLTFVYLSIRYQTVNKEFSGIFGIIAGYYFGKNTTSK
jgi:hypothetical protein